MSYSIEACVPAPVCKDKIYPMKNLDSYQDITEYLGDPDKADWVGQGKPLQYRDNILLAITKEVTSTVLATSRYMWYGNVKARLKTARGRGVVTAFIIYGDVKDEIDYEFIGVDLHTAQTNYYFQGIPNYANSENITSLSNTYDEFHDYEIRWTPESITWLVDGKVGRVKKKSETWNATSNQWDYPQTPSRVQISVWAGGLATNGKGTIDWAGGEIDWNSGDSKDYGYFFATFGQIEVECYKTSKAPGTNKGISYWYNDIKSTNDTVVDGNRPTILKSNRGTGYDMDAMPPSASGTNPPEESNVHTVPGGNPNPGNTNPGGGSDGDNTDNGSGGGGGGGNGGGGGGGGGSGGSSCGTDGFSQGGCDNNGGSSDDPKSEGAHGADRTLGASAFAVIIGFAGLLLL